MYIYLRSRFVKKWGTIMNEIMEKPFEYLRRQETGEPFEAEVVKNWYIARAYVLEALKDVSFLRDSKSHLDVVVLNDSPLMLSIVRQVALSAHYINYMEGTDGEACRNRTVITLVSQNPDIIKELEKEEYLYNLPKYCKYTKEDAEPVNDDSYIDIEIHVVNEYRKDHQDLNEYVFKEEDVVAFYRSKEDEGVDIYSIDTRKAIYTNRIYNLGELIDNLPAEDIHCAKRYVMALDVFQHKMLKERLKPMIDKVGWQDQLTVKEMLSNIFCADCFESRSLGINHCQKHLKEEKELWADNNDVLSRSEHARWVVEKLIMGYYPLNESQRYKDESLFYNKKKRLLYRKSLKKNPENPTHIDLCSYADLRRINPNDMKYDSFLMLAIPYILNKVR